MKKSLLALAAMGAFAGAAQAQSSVTVYGILDVGFSGYTTRTPQVGTTPAFKTNSNSFNAVGSETTSRLGFRGTEDLGGGTSAFFTLEMQLNPAAADNFTNMANRQSFVGLAQKGLGRAAIGTQYTPVHLAVGRTDPGQQNNMIGNVIYQTNTAQGSGTTAVAYTVRQNNSITLATERMAGFSAYGMYSQNNTDRTQYSAAYTSTAASNGGNTNVTGWGLGIDYNWQKLLLTANYQSFKNENDLVASATAVNPVATSGTNNNGTNVTNNQMYFAGTYDFGILKAYAQYINTKITSNLNSNTYLKRSAQQIGVRGYVTKTVEGWASVGNGRFQSFGNGEPTANFVGWQVGSNYWLSKRTNAYAIFGSTSVSSVNSGTASTGINGSGGANSYGIGVRHTF